MRPNIRLVGENVLLMQAERRLALSELALKANRWQDEFIEIVAWLIFIIVGLGLAWWWG